MFETSGILIFDNIYRYLIDHLMLRLYHGRTTLGKYNTKSICISTGAHKPTRAYRKTSNISRSKSQNLNVSRFVLQLSFLNPLKPDVKSRMKM